MWGIVLYDNKLKRFWIGRDHVGIIPLYWGTGKEGELYVSSEFKCIED
jgi:asparagine synthase (glutamine-hydrolysing)